MGALPAYEIKGRHFITGDAKRKAEGGVPV